LCSDSLYFLVCGGPFIAERRNQLSKNTEPIPPRSAELTEAAAEVVDRIKALTRIPKRYLIEEAILNYLPDKYKEEDYA